MQETDNIRLGSNKDFAYATFGMLKGKSMIDKTSILRVCLMEHTKGERLITLKSLSCTLSQQAENCKIITRELFKFLNLKTTFS